MTLLIGLFLLSFNFNLFVPAPSQASNTLPQSSLHSFQPHQTGGQQRAASQSESKRGRTRARKRPARRPDVIYYPTPAETVTEMLRLANIKQGDVLYDLGSGDGRIPIAAAQLYGIRAIGIEIDPQMVEVARQRAQEANVSSLVSFRQEDLFRTKISEASIVTLYLSNRINLLLRPKLLRELRPGTRIISHDFHMGDWESEQKVKVPWQGTLYRTIYVWTVPARSTKRR